MFPSSLILADFSTEWSPGLSPGLGLLSGNQELSNHFSQEKKLIMPRLEPTHTMLRSGRSAHQAFVTRLPCSKQVGSSNNNAVWPPKNGWVANSILADFIFFVIFFRACALETLWTAMIDTGPRRGESPGSHCYQVCEIRPTPKHYLFVGFIAVATRLKVG